MVGVGVGLGGICVGVGVEAGWLVAGVLVSVGWEEVNVGVGEEVGITLGVVKGTGEISERFFMVHLSPGEI